MLHSFSYKNIIITQYASNLSKLGGCENGFVGLMRIYTVEKMGRKGFDFLQFKELVLAQFTN